MRNRAMFVALAAVVLGGCGGGEPTLSRSSADQLHAQVAAVRTAAADGDRAAALEALDGLEDQLRDLQAGGSLAEADAAALRRGIGRARRRVREEVAPAATAMATATATATPEPTPEATETPAPEEDGPGKGKGKGNAKGHGEDDEGDEE